MILRLLEGNPGHGGAPRHQQEVCSGQPIQAGEPIGTTPLHIHPDRPGMGFVGRRKNGKYWLLHAYTSEADEMLAYR
ncbi:hypothetical protein [Pontibacter rugosus]|uniref:Uncharacterized protein n=1 Tax=Pontibacter rugosus TaxID=1745966 RepID=A0ABW3SSW0_9BACT